MTRRPAFTLIELLVVMACIAALVGLLLPAVQRVRETSNMTECQNNLRQIGVALHSYEGAKKLLPPSRAYPSTLVGSVHALILPYLEQEAIYRQIDFTKPYTDPVNVPVQQMRVKSFVCPADPNSFPPGGLAPTSYRANEGVNILNAWGDSDPNGNNTALPSPNGGFFVNSKYKLSDMKDGLSTTAAFSEHLIGDFSNAQSSPLSDTYQPGTYPATPDQALADCNAIDINDLTKQGNSNVGAPWLQSNHSITSYWHDNIPNGRSCKFPPNRIFTTATSAHPGSGVNVLLFDGAVRFVRGSISLTTWRAYGTRNGQEVVDNP